MEKATFEMLMIQANGNLMTILENSIMYSTGCARLTANLLANHILDILDANKKYTDDNEKRRTQ